MEEELANLSLLDDEEEAFQEEAVAMERTYQFCLVERCLTDSVVHFPSLRNTMVDLWNPIGGICITDLGKNALELNLKEFWRQVHKLPPGLMTESMAKQFGDFCGKFLEYDTSIPSLGHKKYMHIRVFLDVSAPLKRKKKLSLFCFICGKLGHGESYCPFRVRVELSKIVFGWDLSLRAVVRHRNTTMSRWLREADDSQCNTENLESLNQIILLNDYKVTGRNLRGIFENQILNPNLIPLGSVQQYVTNGQNNWRNWSKDDSVNDGLVNGPMNLVLEWENDPIAMLEGKKRQRVVDGPLVLLGSNAGTGSMDLPASSGEQSSRALNENTKLECSWFGEITNSKEAQE
ncbi:hypothetical protein Goklo_028933 [Gossypium klotzschianum]|uniref:CCHC-type domain-containing protein n=1 Tax=Gossypium klotzschianum TaxID=34286 RepID=A0A7J8W449_9ROSI|nr:hypothetical protein [Gossypium klotzschianum]